MAYGDGRIDGDINELLAHACVVLSPVNKGVQRSLVVMNCGMVTIAVCLCITIRLQQTQKEHILDCLTFHFILSKVL